MKQIKALKVTISVLCVLSLLLGSVLTFALFSAAEGDFSVPTDLMDTTWSHYGYENKAYTADKNGTYNGSIDGTLFSGYVTQTSYNEVRFGGTADTQYGGGAGDWGGLRIFPADNDTSWLVIDGSVAIPGWQFFVNGANIGVSNFANTEYLLQVSVEFVDNDADGAEDDVKLGFWINGISVARLDQQKSGAAEDGYVYKNDVACNFGSYALLFVSKVGGSSITPRSYVATLPEGYTTLQPADFDVADGTYAVETQGTANTATEKSTSTVSKFDKVIFEVNEITFNGVIDLNFGGQSSWEGFKLRAKADGNLSILTGYGQALSEQIMNDGVAGVDLVGGTYNLKITLVDLDDTRVKVGVWFNDKLYNNTYFLATFGPGCGDVRGTWMGITSTEGTGSITLKSKMPTPTAGLPVVTWSSYYNFPGYDVAFNNGFGNYLNGGLNGKLFDADVTIPAGSRLRFDGGAQPSGGADYTWFGYMIEVQTDGTLLLHPADGTLVPGNVTLKPADFGLTTFANTRFNLKVETAYTVATASTTTAQYTLWINDIYAARVSTTRDSVKFGGTVLAEGNGVIPHESAGALAPPTDLPVIGWGDFGIEDGASLTDGNSYRFSGTTMNNTLFDGDVVMAEGSEIRYAGADKNGWVGIHFRISNGCLVLCSDTLTFQGGNMDLAPADFGLTTFADTQFNLKIRTINLNTATPTVYVWVNDRYAGERTGTLSASFADHTLGTFIMGYDTTASGHTVKAVYPTVGGGEEEKETLPTDYTTIYASDFGVASGSYTMSGGSYVGHSGTLNASFGVTTIDKMILHYEEIKFEGQVHMNFFGASNDLGWKLLSEGDTLKLLTGWCHLTANNGYGNSIVLSDEVAGVDLVGGTYDLKISVAYEGDTAKLGLWFNNVLYNDEYYVFDMTKKGNDDFGTYLAFRSDSNGTVTFKSTNPDTAVPTVPTDLTEITWTDFYRDGSAATLEQPLIYDGASYLYNGTFNNVLFNGDIEFPSANNVKMIVAGDWHGLYLVPDGATMSMHVQGTLALDISASSISASTFGLTSFEDTRFNLKMAVTDNVDGSAATLNFWINDIYAFTAKLTATGAEKVNGSILPMGGTKGGDPSAIPYAPATTGGDGDDDDDEPILPPTNLTQIGWADLGLTEAVYPAVPGDLALRGTYAASLDGTLLVGDITLGNGWQLRYAGSDGWQGLVIAVDNSQLWINSATLGSNYSQRYDASYFGLTSLVDTKFNLKVSLDISDDGEQYTFGIWVNDIMAGEYFTLNKGNHLAGSVVGFYDNNSGGSITLGTPQTVVPEQLPTDYTVLIPADFGIEDGAYTAIYNDLVVWGKTDKITTPDKTLWHFEKIKFEGNVELNFAGPANGWDGYRLRALSDGRLMLYSGWSQSLKPEQHFLVDSIAGVDVVGGDYDLKLTLKMTDDNRMEIGVWFNDVLYNNQYVYADLSQMTGDEMGNNGDALGTCLGVSNTSSVGTSGTITIGTPSTGDDDDDGEQGELPTGPDTYTEITWNSFGVDDGKYLPQITELYPTHREWIHHGTYTRPIDGTKFIGYLKQDGGTQVRFAGNDANPGWSGIIVTAGDSGILTFDGSITLPGWKFNVNPADVGLTTFLDTEYKLTVTIAYVDADNDGNKDDVMLGLWVNDVMVTKLDAANSGCAENGYIYKTDMAANFGPHLGIYPIYEGRGITLRSAEVAAPPPPEVIAPPTDLINIGVTDFGGSMMPGPMPTGGLSGQLKELDSFNGTLFSVDINMITETPSEGDTYIRLGGREEGWEGFSIQSKANGVLNFINFLDPNGSLITAFMPGVAGVDFFGEAFNLKISTEFVDNDGDGEEDDIKFGVYFNDALYNGEYYYVNDYAPLMTTYLLTYTVDAGKYPLQLDEKIVEIVDLGEFGFDDDYTSQFQQSEEQSVDGLPLGANITPFSGDAVTLCLWVLIPMLALLGCLSVLLVAAKKKQNNGK